MSLGYFSGYGFSIGHHSIYLRDIPIKVMWTTFSNPLYDLPKAIDKVKGILTLFNKTLFVAFYLLFFELWSEVFDKLLHPLTITDGGS